MESTLLFLHIIAWIVGVISTIYSLFLTYWAFTYTGSLEEIVDSMKGYKKTFNITKPWLIAIICWAFIIAF